MALGGGTFIAMNKVFPGTYINFKSRVRAMSNISDRGVLAMAMPLNWGHDGIKAISADDFLTNTLNTLGHNYADEEMIYLREAFCGAKIVLLYNLNEGGAKASNSYSNGALTVTAINSGITGNNIALGIQSVYVSGGPTTSAQCDIITYVCDTVTGVQYVADVQRVSRGDFSSIVSNKFVSFAIDITKGPLVDTVNTDNNNLINGANGVVSGQSHTDFLKALENERFNTLVYAGTDTITASQYYEYTLRRREEDGAKFVLVLSGTGALPNALNQSGYEGVIAMKNSVKTTSTSGVSVNAGDGVYWLAGKTAGAEINESLTNALYDGELELLTDYNKAEQQNFIESGLLCFYSQKDYKNNNLETRILVDINTFTDFYPEKNQDFSNNQIIRVLDQWAIDVSNVFNNYYLGKVQNTATGRNILKADIVNLGFLYQNIQAIEDFIADDVAMTGGMEKGDVVSKVYLKPIGAMDKLYMSVEVI